jgi:hypothetical protein
LTSELLTKRAKIASHAQCFVVTKNKFQHFVWKHLVVIGSCHCDLVERKFCPLLKKRLFEARRSNIRESFLQMCIEDAHADRVAKALRRMPTQTGRWSPTASSFQVIPRATP